MQHFDRGHLPEPDEHFVENIVRSAVLVLLIVVEVASVGTIAFGALYLGRLLIR